jgi:hypothetical protein
MMIPGSNGDFLGGPVPTKSRSLADLLLQHKAHIALDVVMLSACLTLTSFLFNGCR